MTAQEATSADRSETETLLRRIFWVAVFDLLLLIPLLAGAITGSHQLAPVLGPPHGVGFVLEVFLAARGAFERRWGWWYPLAIVLTAGPLGAFAGHRRAGRQALVRSAS